MQEVLTGHAYSPPSRCPEILQVVSEPSCFVYASPREVWRRGKALGGTAAREERMVAVAASCRHLRPATPPSRICPPESPPIPKEGRGKEEKEKKLSKEKRNSMRKRSSSKRSLAEKRQEESQEKREPREG